jgi:hypothetical protein
MDNRPWSLAQWQASKWSRLRGAQAPVAVADGIAHPRVLEEHRGLRYGIACFWRIICFGRSAGNAGESCLAFQCFNRRMMSSTVCYHQAQWLRRGWRLAMAQLPAQQRRWPTRANLRSCSATRRPDSDSCHSRPSQCQNAPSSWSFCNINCKEL